MTDTAVDVLRVPHVIAGRLDDSAEVEHTSGGSRFRTPRLDLNSLVWRRDTPGPAFDTPIADIIDFLAATGARLHLDTNPILAQALEDLVKVSPLGRRILENAYRVLPGFFDRDLLEFQVATDIGGADLVDGWRRVQPPGDHNAYAMRGFPPRLIHVLAGNAPPVAPLTIVRGALTKGVNLLKLPSNDLMTATAILRTMAEIDPDHPVVRSFTAVYWRGGDEAVEGALFRPQYFDKLVAWGGEAAIRGAQKYLGPGFQLVSFDPKISISLVGREAFDSDERLDEAAEAAAIDATIMNQDACGASRFQFVEGDVEQVDRFCERLVRQLNVDRWVADAQGPPVPQDLRVETDALRQLAPFYRVWGGYGGEGLVLRSDEPVDWYPTAKMVNVVPVSSLKEAVRFATVATQTVGIYPQERRLELRDALASAGVQRIVPLGGAFEGSLNGPHDDMIPTHRLLRWVVDEHVA